MTAFYRWQGDDLILSCHLQPRASRDEFCGRHGDSLKIRIQAPPIEGRANDRLIRFLARQFGVAKSAVEILGGELGRQKRVRIAAPERLPEELGIER
ncbi:DUF167 family protein [Marinobacterium aestuariivivens]|uniref:UPF0235 protein ACFQDL_09650 n=1 Tax=Marinobacterium aestuariivivens TaxID=1698799 RepID=A0ABW1ZYL4_9GAMM